MDNYSIEIKDLWLHAYHGVLPEETRLGQDFEIDLYIDTSAPDLSSDEIENVLSYADVVERVKEIFTAHPYKLIEKAAYELLEGLNIFPTIKYAKVQLKKPNPPIPEKFKYVSVILEKSYT